MKLRWSVLAQADLADIRRAIGLDNPRAAIRVAGRVRETARRVADFPLSAQAALNGTVRTAPIRGSPYLLIYAVRPDHILILRVWHGARAWPFDPR